MLRRLSGETHTVYTGLALIYTPLCIDEVWFVSSSVTFNLLSEDTITQYFSIVNPLDKAGAYGIQDGTSLIIDHFEGSLTNIMGLPIESLTERLQELGLLDALLAK